MVSDLERIPASAFVAVDTRGLRVGGSSARCGEHPADVRAWVTRRDPEQRL
jgi:hypothetical protein